MDIDKINLYRMTHIKNIPHISKYGITHKSSVNADVNFVPIGDKSLINFRDTKTISLKGKSLILGDYIPFYFGIRMPMLYVIQHGFNFVTQATSAEDIVYLAVNLSGVIKDKKLNYIFSDGHATDLFTTFYDESDVDNLPTIIDWEAVKQKQWNENLDIKRKKQAEFLIIGGILPQHIIGYVCYNENAKNVLMKYGINETQIKIFPKAYY